MITLCLCDELPYRIYYAESIVRCQLHGGRLGADHLRVTASI